MSGAGAAAHRVVVIGGGFGGLRAVKALGRRRDLEVTLIDRHNYHLFQPLSYQVATGALAAGDIAMPLRHIFRGDKQVTVLLGEVNRLELDRRQVVLTADVPGGVLTVPYDTLIVAGGSDYSYFGHDEWRTVALEVKTLDSALEVRGRILHAFEVAELEPGQEEIWLTFVVVGAGPTGVEMAGQIAELAADTLAGEFRRVDPRVRRVLLIETTNRVLGSFRDPLPRRAQRSLERLGVTVMLGHTVVDVREDAVVLEDGDGVRSEVATRTVVWAAGVNASPLARMLGEVSGAETDRAGRLTVNPDLSLPNHPEVLALGDMVRVRDADSGEPVTYPGLAPVAMQQGSYAGRVVVARLAGKPAPGPFRYRDKGTLATIGRARAVADIKGLRFSGFLAWATWLFVHIFYLIGFENRAVVLTRWGYSYLTRGRGSRLITEAAKLPPPPPAPPAT
ncbi:MAG TPA: NAD(P)/FAD-dependent oxidoreductase [Solirubrobacteraceae bacterium]|nr:NAD(P)/FAD-dependent oxidoreductase [Solirubrobacteraceae bacterium]